MGRENELDDSSPTADEQRSLEHLLSKLPSRRELLASGLGLAAGVAALRPDAIFDTATAAPQDVRGSANIVVKSFSNKKGAFFLYSDGSIVDKDGNRTSENPNSRWPLVTTYKRPRPIAGKPGGSPWVAVDVVQDADGTHVLFADGSVRSPEPGEASEPGVGKLQCYTIFAQPTGVAYHRGMTRSGNVFTFETEFREVPKFFLVDAVGVDNANYWATGHPGVSTRMTITTRSATLKPIGRNILVIIIGEVEGS